MKSLDEADFTIIGLGLMGASLAAALRPHCRSILGVDLDDEALRWCKAQRWIDEGYQHPEQAVSHADVVVLATPVRAILGLLDTVPDYLRPGTILTDLGSTKVAICQKMQELPTYIQAVGGHPLCGREVSGASYADPRLFQDRTFVLVPTSRTSPEALALLEQMVSTIGAHPMHMNAEIHDRLVAITSHLPYLVACTLTRTAAQAPDPDDLLRRLAASGFRDTSRLAGSDVRMMIDILQTNRGNILEGLEIYLQALQDLINILAEGGEEDLKIWLENAQETRRRLVT
ncbi:prephenate dehydrogenase [uncultured Thermanaerothrix sp.]|uniref:prephenate dehydrogenase n=1 Tax=uncultured Thermanaerothrix sp. TaxID=1195149 RepID=UPI0026323E00|nr:prephenate dehydrogenase [uncultured Thermanaerothrix sp.]